MHTRIVVTASPPHTILGTCIDTEEFLSNVFALRLVYSFQWALLTLGFHSLRHNSADEIRGHPLLSICEDATSALAWAISREEAHINTVICNMRGQQVPLSVSCKPFSEGTTLVVLQPGYVGNFFEPEPDTGIFAQASIFEQESNFEQASIFEQTSDFNLEEEVNSYFESRPEGQQDTTGHGTLDVQLSSDHCAKVDETTSDEQHYYWENNTTTNNTAYAYIAASLPMPTSDFHSQQSPDDFQAEYHSQTLFHTPHKAEFQHETSYFPKQEGVRIFPRRKSWQAPEVQGPVYVSNESLSALKGLPLHNAAYRLGISTTALKKACRKLGMGRWMYNSTKKKKE